MTVESTSSPAETAPLVTADELLTADYSQAKYPCDVVMKGGVTSGVVYPQAMCRLARDYVFHNIGGTSAGAIAAALSAAAEYSRREGRDGFNQLAALPNWLGSGTHLQDLFQPSRSTQPLFRVLLALLGLGSLKDRLTRAGCAALKGYARAWVRCSALAAALFAWPIATAWGTWEVIYLAILALAAAFFAGVFGIAIDIWATLRIAIPDNNFGMCTGLTNPPGTPEALTPWLAKMIDTYADVPGPLVFGDLWGAQPGNDGVTSVPFQATGSEVLDDFAQRNSRSINLEMVTTNTTIGRPYRLPFSPLEDLFYYFDPNELRKLFPETVVKHMEDHPAAGWLPKTYKGKNIVPLPEPKDFPVIVAARMSLSFPLLFSAIPLYAVPRPNSVIKARPVTKCWFSDGGISSNIPVHFFDNPLPRWPTFAINLRGVPKPGVVPVAMATENVADANDVDDSGTGRLPQFLSAVLDSMQNWVDNTQMRLPGYMERVVEVELDGTEGGLHLTMLDTTRQKLAGYGLRAGETLVKNFLPRATPGTAFDPAGPWSEHRWVRYRNVFAALNEWLWRFNQGYGKPPIPPDVPYTTLATNPPDPVVYSGYAWNGAQQAANTQLASDLQTLSSYANKLPPRDNMTEGAPAPGPESQHKPRI